MNKLLFMCLFVMLTLGVTAQQPYTRVSVDTFKVSSTIKLKSQYIPTGKYYVDVDKKAYEIYIHTTTRGKNAGKTFCYIRKKKSWKKIAVKPEEVS